MNRTTPLLLAVASLCGCAATNTTIEPVAVVETLDAAGVRERVASSLVVVRYTFENEMGRRELEGHGIVLSADGMVMCHLSMMPLAIADSQIKDVKIVIPNPGGSTEPKELDATLILRDERCDLAFVRAVEPQAFTPIELHDTALRPGDALYSVGLLPETSGFTPFVRTGTINAVLRGPVPMAMASGLTWVGAPVVDAQGRMIGIVTEQANQLAVLNAGQEQQFAALSIPPLLMVPTRDFLPYAANPPTDDSARNVPWLGVAAMNGLSDELAKFYGLEDKPGVQVGDVIPGFPAEKAGLLSGDVIISVNGQPIERGDTAEELPMIVGRQIMRMKVGEVVRLGVIRTRGEPPIDIDLTLGARPATATTAARFWAEDLGFTVRDLVFQDRYARRLDDDTTGAAVTFIRQGSNAAAGNLNRGDIVTRLNQTPVTDVAQFEQTYKAFREASPTQPVVIEVLRGVDTQILRIEPPR
jgi:serine protease Do